MEFLLFLFCIVIPALAAFVAASKGRNPVLWILASLVFPPAFLFLLFGSPGRTCPFCAEGVKPTATVCPHCQRAIPAP